MTAARIIAGLLVIILPACVIGPKSLPGKYELSSTPCKGCRTSELRGAITDHKTKEGLPFGTVMVYDSTGQARVSAGAADVDGNFVIKPLPHGIYTITAHYSGYHSITIPRVSLDSAIVSLKIEMVIDPTPPPDMNRDKQIDNKPGERTLDREQIKRMPK